jgi:subfamily B ATP-binding cassette protein MsbA
MCECNVAAMSEAIGRRTSLKLAAATIAGLAVLPDAFAQQPKAPPKPENVLSPEAALDRLMKGRTVIMIAHRLSTIRDAHKIIVLKDGVVAEQGTHDELIALGGVYAELHRIQYEQPPAAAASPPANPNPR